MTSKLAIKHKDSLVLKENRPQGKNGVTEQSKLKICEQLSLPWLTLGVFLIYWLVLCPLTWAISYYFWPFPYWPPAMTYLFWIAAFVIWLVITCGLIIFWRRLQVEQSLEINTTPKYGSDSERSPLSAHHQILSEDAEFLETEKRNDSHESESKKSDRGNHLKRELPPLVIHKQISGENMEDTSGTVRVEDDERSGLNHIASDYAEKSALQDYLKLVTVSPSEEVEVKSPRTPMSPRELFFIDLIREAERAESAGTRFFPSEATENVDAKTNHVNGTTGGEDTAEHRKDMKDAEDAKIDEDNKWRSKRESSYFIADVVESPTREKTEVFLQIDPSVGEETGEINCGETDADTAIH